MSSSHFLASLDVDLLTQIILHLNVTDIVHMMVSSRHFKKLVSRQKLWQTLCGRDFFTEIATNSFDDSPAVVQAVQDERWTDAYKEMTQLVPRFDRVSEFSQRNKKVTKEDENKADALLKFLFVGSSWPLLLHLHLDVGVGKTSLLLRYGEDTWIDQPHVSIGVDFRITRFETPSKLRLTLQLWDYFSRSSYYTLSETFLRAANGVFICYDVTKEMSFQKIDEWWAPQVKRAASQLGAIVTIVACKCDVGEKGRVITREQGEKLAANYGWRHVETSAKLAVGVNELISSTIQISYKSALQKGTLIKPLAQKTSSSNGGVSGFFKKLLGWK